MADFLDTYTAADGTDVSARASDSGHTYDTTGYVITGNEAYPATGTQVVTNYAADTVDYDVTATVDVKSQTGDIGITLNNGTADHGGTIIPAVIWLSIACNSGTISLYRRDAFGNVVILASGGSLGGAPSVGSHTLVIEQRGASGQTIKWDATTVATGNDTTTQPTGLGFLNFGTVTSTTGPHINTLQAQNVGSVAIVAGLSTPGQHTDVQINADATEATGGTATFNHQWYRDTTDGFTPSSGNLLTGQATLTLADTTAVAGTTYFYVCRYIETSTGTPTGRTIDGNQIQASLWLKPFAIVDIGDSTTNGGIGAGAAPGPYRDLLLSRLHGPRKITSSNQGHGGATAVSNASTGWQKGDASGYYAAAVTAANALFSTATNNYIRISLGINDVVAAHSAASFGAAIAQLCSDLIADVTHLDAILLDYQCTCGFPGRTSYMRGYNAQIDALDGSNGGKVVVSDRGIAQRFFTEQPQYTAEFGGSNNYTHPTGSAATAPALAGGGQMYGEIIAATMDAALNPAAGAGNLNRLFNNF